MHKKEMPSAFKIQGVQQPRGEPPTHEPVRTCHLYGIKNQNFLISQNGGTQSSSGDSSMPPTIFKKKKKRRALGVNSDLS